MRSVLCRYVPRTAPAACLFPRRSHSSKRRLEGAAGTAATAANAILNIPTCDNPASSPSPSSWPDNTDAHGPLSKGIVALRVVLQPGIADSQQPVPAPIVYEPSSSREGFMIRVTVRRRLSPCSDNHCLHTYVAPPPGVVKGCLTCAAQCTDPL